MVIDHRRTITRNKALSRHSGEKTMQADAKCGDKNKKKIIILTTNYRFKNNLPEEMILTQKFI